jgi:pyruvate/2-oxoglutarate dehydrogenase complex dihydrolipoamide dehydrogenase (E3) component
MAADRFDAIVIGAGQAGVPLTTDLAAAGWRVALVEREHVGGTCVNEGCTPTKTMVASGRVAYLVRRAADFGVRAGPVEIDMGVVRQRKRDIVDEFRTGNEQRVADSGAELLMGTARFTGERTISVDLNDGNRRDITAPVIVINTGERPAAPPIERIDTVPWLTSTTVMELASAPEHLIVLGGGYIGLEFGQLFRRLGSQVTVVQHGGHLLGREDDDVAEAVLEIMRDDGIDVLLNTEAERAEPAANGGVSLGLTSSGGDRALTGSHLLVAIGRRPNTDDLGLDAAGVVTNEHGYVQVNERLESSAEGIYALGDVKGPPAFTHISYDDYRILRDNLLHDGSRTTSGRLVPYTVFIDPQLGCVGMSEREARQQGRNVRVASIPMAWVARALETSETRGMMKAIIDASTDQILGCAVLGIEGGEVMSMIQIAMMGNLPWTTLRDGVFSHPSLSEALNTLFSNVSDG